jgi:hypothetical protein
LWLNTLFVIFSYTAMSNSDSSRSSISNEKTPLLNPPVTIQYPQSDDTSTDGRGPCGKYGNEDDLTSSAVHNTQRAKRKLMIASIICLIFLVGEFFGELIACLQSHDVSPKNTGN